MTNTKTLYEKLVSDNLTDDDKENLLTLLDKVTRQKEAKAISSKKYMEKLKLNNDAMDKIRLRNIDYYIKNKEISKDKERERYNTNNETRERKKEKSLLYYHNKNDHIPKLKRGRKPKPIDPDEPPKIIRPRGRPPKIYIPPLTDDNPSQ